MGHAANRHAKLVALVAFAAGCKAAAVAVPPPPPPPPDPVFEVGVDLVPMPTPPDDPVPLEEGKMGKDERNALAEDFVFDKDRRRPTGATASDGPKEEKPELPPDQQPAPPPIAAATTEKTGPRVDAAQIQQAVAQRRDLFARCLHVDTSIEIDATISPSGRVLQAKSDRSVPNEPKLRDCIVDAFRKLSLEPFGSDAPAHVKFALALKRR